MNIEVGDLVKVKKDSSLSPALRFHYNKTGIVMNTIDEDDHPDWVISERYDYIVLFSDGTKGVFRFCDLDVISKANEDNDI